MRPFPWIVALVAPALALSACSREEAQPPRPVTPTPTPPPAPALGYACESGRTVMAAYPDPDTARITYEGRAHDLRVVVSASGARFAGDGLEWWIASRNGQETATLSRLGPNEQVGSAVLERCSRPAPGGAAPLPQATEVTVAVAAPCLSGQLSARVAGGDAGAGNRGTVIALTNTGATPCVLSGHPRLMAQDSQGRNLTGLTIEPRDPAQDQSPAPITLTPQGQAFFDVTWNVMAEGPCPRVARLAVSAPGDQGPVLTQVRIQPCGGRMGVTPFRAEGGPAVGNTPPAGDQP